MTPDNEKNLSLLRVISELIGAVTGEIVFSTADCIIVLREEMRNLKKIWNDTNKAKLKVIVKEPKATDRRVIIHTKNTGSWMTVRVLR